MEITWQVEDGYVGKSRPQYTEIPDEDLEGMTEEEKEDYIYQWIQQDFDDKISWVITRRSDD